MTATLLAQPEPGPRGFRGDRPRVRVTRPPAFDPAPDAERPFEAAWPVEPAPVADPVADGREAAGRAAQRYIRICVEVLNGYRPATHLRGLSGSAALGEAVARLRSRRNARSFAPALSAGAGPVRGPAAADRSVPADSSRAGGRPPGVGSAGVEPAGVGPAGGVGPASLGSASLGSAGIGSGNAAPLRPATRPGNAPAIGAPPVRRPRNAARPTPFELSRLHVSEPTPGVAEIVALLSHAGITIAIAMRLERRGTTWTCVVVQVI